MSCNVFVIININAGGEKRLTMWEMLPKKTNNLIKNLLFFLSMALQQTIEKCAFEQQNIPNIKYI